MFVNFADTVKFYVEKLELLWQQQKVRNMTIKQKQYNKPIIQQ